MNKQEILLVLIVVGILEGLRWGSSAKELTQEKKQQSETVSAEKTTTGPETQPPQEPQIRIKQKNQWELGVCTQTRGSGAWLREWIEFQILGGVDHIWVIDDTIEGTEDGTRAILQYYKKIGFVTIIEQQNDEPGCRIVNGQDFGKLANKNIVDNCKAPKICGRHAAPHVNWLLFIDTDEFVYPRSGCSLSNFIKTCADPYQTQVTLRWERFGTNGFDYHPLGLLTESFLSSGGDCSQVTHGRYRAFHKQCSTKPFEYCLECRHTKTIYNTKHCAAEYHFGNVHVPANTTKWKRKNKLYPATDGNESDWRSPSCLEKQWGTDVQDCQNWLNDMNMKNQSEVSFKSSCCSAGIGLNHYGTKSKQFFNRKIRRKNEDSRGMRPASIDIIDLSGFLSFSVLRFVRAVRSRFISLGLPVSTNVRFHKKCFIESNFYYIPTSNDTKVVESLAKVSSPEACCESCSVFKNCSGFTFNHPNKKCTTFHPTVPYWPRTILPGNRTWNYNHTSGVVIREEECSYRIT
eukprot:TRINITY_DN4474_c2_g2_i1.p1 TRINITY_DN4474_c2_g2~~TRINITY_DN4474_c2_g2_i1.p1  ORF type:complete len:518 (+),score=27.43 TRINITY_DN4474_c2_g2_i1:88-1641(+)